MGEEEKMTEGGYGQGVQDMEGEEMIDIFRWQEEEEKGRVEHEKKTKAQKRKMYWKEWRMEGKQVQETGWEDKKDGKKDQEDKMKEIRWKSEEMNVHYLVAQKNQFHTTFCTISNKGCTKKNPHLTCTAVFAWFFSL